MNESSSRSHAVLTFYISQVDKNDKEGFSVKENKINLIGMKKLIFLYLN
jgi:hypothetical protein